jgi:uncharacterized membrane protein
LFPVEFSIRIDAEYAIYMQFFANISRQTFPTPSKFLHNGIDQAYAVVHSETGPPKYTPETARILRQENAMQCPSCHREVSGTFCNFCGATLAAAAPGGSPLPPPITSVSSAGPAASSSGLSDNAAAAIAYITIIPSILFLVLDPYKRIPLVRFHSVQNLVLAVVWIIVWIAIMIMEIVLHFIPFIGILFMLVNLFAFVVFFIAWLMAIVKAAQGQFFKLPFIGDFAAKQAGV